MCVTSPFFDIYYSFAIFELSQSFYESSLIFNHSITMNFPVALSNSIDTQDQMLYTTCSWLHIIHFENSFSTVSVPFHIYLEYIVNYPPAEILEKCTEFVLYYIMNLNPFLRYNKHKILCFTLQDLWSLLPTRDLTVTIMEIKIYILIDNTPPRS